MRYPKLASLLIGTALAIGLGAGAQAAPFGYSRIPIEATTPSDGLVIKAVTRAGVAHRSSRRTARRVVRRHTYY
jgi:hypothetical protein